MGVSWDFHGIFMNVLGLSMIVMGFLTGITVGFNDLMGFSRKLNSISWWVHGILMHVSGFSWNFGLEFHGIFMI